MAGSTRPYGSTTWTPSRASAWGPGRVTSTFYYDAAGRANRRDTEVTSQVGSAPESGSTLRQTWQHDALGNVVAATYPVVVNPPAGINVPARSVDSTFAHGSYLTSVSVSGTSAAGADLTYHKSGLLHEVKHRGGVGKDVFTVPVSGMARWSGMSLAAGAHNLSPVTYDPSGNVTRIGSDRFYYGPQRPHRQRQGAPPGRHQGLPLPLRPLRQHHDPGRLRSGHQPAGLFRRQRRLRPLRQPHRRPGGFAPPSTGSTSWWRSTSARTSMLRSTTTTTCACSSAAPRRAPRTP